MDVYNEIDTNEPYETRSLYSASCSKCNKEIKLRTQHDNGPEYYTTVEIYCDCGNRVRFELPVN